MFVKPIFIKVLVGFTIAVAAAGAVAGYFGRGKPGKADTAALAVAVSAPAKPPMLSISGQFKKDLSKHPSFVLGDRPISFEGDEEGQPSFLAGGTVEVVSPEGEVVASGKIAENGTFSLEIPLAPKYVVRARNDVVSVSYAVVTGGLPDMKKTETARPDSAENAGEHGEKAAAEH